MRPQGIVLASTSPYRRELLARLGLPFESVSPDYEEERLGDRTGVTPAVASEIALEHARGKAASHAPRYPRHLILASDQVCECEGRALEKAGSERRAVEQLRYLSGKEHRLHTSVVLLDTGRGTRREDVVVTRIRMRAFSEEEAQCYVRTEKPLDSAGSYYSEKLGIALFETFETVDPTAIIGLPLISVRRLLSRAGVDVLQPATWPTGRVNGPKTDTDTETDTDPDPDPGPETNGEAGSDKSPHSGLGAEA